MIGPVIISLTNNAALLVTVGLTYDIFYRGKREEPTFSDQVTTGILIGLTAIILMSIPFRWDNGIIFDARTILIGLTALFFNTLPTIIAMVIACAYRLYLGGDGAPTGIALILSSGMIGMLWRRYRYHPLKVWTLWELYLFGIVVHFAMILSLFLLPHENNLFILRYVALPVIIIYPIGTTLLGYLLTYRQKTRQIEAALRESTLRFNQLATQSLTVTWEVNVEGLFTYVSPMAETVYGYHPEELIGKMHFYDIHPEEGREEFKSATLGAFKEKRGFEDFINAIQKKNGQIIGVSTCALPLLTQDGFLRGYQGTDKDITEKRLTEEALHSEKIRAQGYLDTVETMIVALNPEGTIITANRKACQVLGYREDELIGRSWFDTCLPQKSGEQVFCPVFLKLMAGNLDMITDYHENHIITRDGKLRLISWHNALLRDEQGRITGALSCGEDITSRKEAEDRLIESEYFFRESQRSASIGSYKYDLASDSWVSSEVLDAIFGIDGEFIRNSKSWLNIVHPDDRIIMNQYLKEEVLVNGKNFNKEYRIIHQKDGETRYVLGLGNLKLDTNNNVVSFMGTIQDITSQRKAEIDRQTLERQLIQAQKLESLGVLSGGIAHDFNNILAVIMCYSSLLKKEPEAVQELVPEIEKAASRAADLCRQMMSYAGTSLFATDKVNMTLLVSEMVKMLRATIKQNITIDLDPSLDILTIQADASQIRQIVMNLIINAAEAIDETQGIIRVSLSKAEVLAEQSTQDHLGREISLGWYLCLEVSDTGCGMNDEMKERLFEPFYTTKFTGRGLGMSAVIGIIKAHSGALQLFSAMGEGTTFKIYIPLSHQENVEEIQLQRASSVQWQGSGTLLLVDDEAMLRGAVRPLIEVLGFTVIEASDGKDALEKYQENVSDIAVVLTDIDMPIMNGYEFYQKLNEINPELPFIFSSGYDSTLFSSQIQESDTVKFLFKPYSINKLRETLQDVTERGRI